MDRLALVTTGFCPAMIVRSPTAASSARALVSASPRPMLSTIFFTVGIAMTLEYFISSRRAGRTSSMYFCLSRGSTRVFSVIFVPCRNNFVAMLADTHVAAVGEHRARLARRAVTVGTDQHHVGAIEGCRHVDDAGLEAAGLAAKVALDDVDAVNHDPICFG